MIDYIKFDIVSSEENPNGGYNMVTVKNVESSLTNDKDYQYCLGDIIRHALSRASRGETEDERFTYTFPFTLS